MKAKKENKYLVIKLEDLDNYLNQFTKGTFATKEEERYVNGIPFNTVLKGIQKQRLEECKDANPKYIVCNQDEPYAELIWQIILMGEDAKKVKVLHKGSE